MFRHAGILCSIYFGVVAQTSLISDWPEQVRPFLPAITLVLIAAWSGPTLALFWSALLGLILDCVSTDRLGIQFGLATILALGLQLLQPVWRSRRTLPLVAMTLVTAVCWRLLSQMTYAVLAGRLIDSHEAMNLAVREAAVTGGVALVLFLISGPFRRTSSAHSASRTLEVQPNHKKLRFG